MAPFVALVLLAIVVQDQGDEQDALRSLPRPGVRLIEAGARSLQLPEGATVRPSGRPFGDAVVVTIRAASAQPYAVQVVAAPSVVEVHEGDTVYATFWARRTDGPGAGNLSVHLQESSEPWTQLAHASVNPDGEWRRFHLTGVATRRWPVGALNLAFHLARVAQTVELGGLVVRNLGANVDASKLPFNALRYRGDEATAAWRAEAEVRIRKLRTATLTVRAVDGRGRPLPRANVAVRQLRHAFEFGSFVEPPLLDKGPDGDKYRATFDRLFNKVTVPMYWADWGWEYAEERARYLAYADYFQKRAIPTKAHVLIYPGWTFLPTALRPLASDPAELRRRIDRHVAEVLAATKPFGFVSWDVINETRDLTVLPPLLGPDFYADLFRAAHAAQPKATLYINEYGILTDGGANVANHAQYEAAIRDLVARGAPLGGIGMQGHFAESATPPTELWRLLDRFAKFGLPIQITEFDIATRDAAGQAAYTRDFLTAIFAHPAVTGFTIWGFWEKSMWTKSGALFRTDWTPKPNAVVFEDLVKRRWWTSSKGTTDRNGWTRTQAFKGEHDVTVTGAFGTVRRRVKVDRDVEITVPCPGPR